MNLITDDKLIIKERPPLRYHLAIGLLIFFPALFINIVVQNPFFFWMSLLFSLGLPLLLSRSESLEISEDGICQRWFGRKLFSIKWNEIKSVTYNNRFFGPCYKISSKRSWLMTIDLPIDDDSFPVIKQALAQQGLVLAQAQLPAKSSDPLLK